MNLDVDYLIDFFTKNSESNNDKEMDGEIGEQMLRLQHPHHQQEVEEVQYQNGLIVIKQKEVMQIH
jgi:hypothetical protein